MCECIPMCICVNVCLYTFLNMCVCIGKVKGMEDFSPQYIMVLVCSKEVGIKGIFLTLFRYR